MKILVIGDIYGKKGRQMVSRFVPELKQKYAPDFMIANSENISHGEGPQMKHIEFLKDLGFDALTGGNHSLVNLEDTTQYLNSPESIQLRPDNYFDTKLPGCGHKVFEKNGQRILVINLISGIFFKDAVYNPFMRVQEILARYASDKFDAIVLDFHRETTSESYAMARLLDGQISLYFGTHTHVQTNDDQIFPKGTGFLCEIGFCGVEQSIIGVAWESIAPRFLTGIQRGKNVPDERGDGVLSGLIATIEQGRCTQIEKIRIREAYGVL